MLRSCRLALILGVALAGRAGAEEPPVVAEDKPALVEDKPAVPTGQVEGLVLKRGDRTPVGGVELILDADAQRTFTGTDGAYLFEGVPEGKHTVHLRGGGITKFDGPIEATAGKKRKFVFWVEVKERYSTTVRGRAEVREVPVEQTLSSDEVKRIPGTQGDTLKAVQNLPGVARAPFGGGLLVVWGSAPQDTRTYVDGVFIPTLYHFGGLRSTVNSEMVDQLNFMPGGYGVDYGRGLGGVIEVETRRPKDNGYHGYLQLDIIDGSIMLEGPIVKNLSFAIAARRSWIDVFLPLFTPNNFQLSPSYTDYQAKLRWRPTSSDDAELFVFGTDDALSLVARGDANFTGSLDSHSFFHRAVLSWKHRFHGGASFDVIASGGWDQPARFVANFGKQRLTFNVDLGSYNLRATARVPLASFLRVDAGVDFEGNRWVFSADFGSLLDDFGAGGTAIPTGEQVLLSHGTAPWARLVFTLLDKRLHVVPEFRLELMSLIGQPSNREEVSDFHVLPEPRLHVSYKINKFLDVRGTVGLYHQAPDAGALLVSGGAYRLLPQSGMHYVAGVTVRPTSTLSMELVGFYKELRSLVEPGQRGQPTAVNDGTGRVYGAQIMVRQQLWKGLFGWITYTLSKSERTEHTDVPWHVYQYDQTHILTLIASYKFGSGYQVGMRFRYVTGNPTTPLAGAYEDLNQGRYLSYDGPALSSRLSDFHQLDLRFDKTWTLERFRISVYLDIQNVYNAANPEGTAYNFDFTKSQPVSGLPFLPVFGTRGDF